MGWFNFKLAWRRQSEDVMKSELEALVADLTAKRDAAQTDLDAAVAKLNTLLAEIPVEFHSMTQEIFDKLKVFFQ